VVEEVFTDKVMRACRRNANKVASVNKNYVSSDDIMGEMFLWVAANSKKVDEWVEEGHKGMGKLNTALFRAGHRYVNKERAQAIGGQLSDMYWYTVPVVEDLLTDVWKYIDWLPSPSFEYERSQSRPSEGNNRTAMMIDVAGAVTALPKEDQEILRDRYSDGGSYIDAIAAKLEITPDGARKRIDRILNRIVEKLGGEPPFWGGGRRAKSNQAAVNETRDQE
jgi:DNA-directed RNA polymerase specialized sigma24 family protein